MEHLAEFYQSPEVLEAQDYSLEHFKTLWKKKRLQFIWLLKHRQEPQENFFNELTTYIVDRILEEHLKPDLERNLAIYVACVYGCAILHQTQPVKHLPKIRFPTFNAEAVEVRHCILIPEYILEPITSLLQAINKDETREACDMLQWLFQEEAFLFCLERPVQYCPGAKEPYPKEKHPQVFINGSASRIKLHAGEELISQSSVDTLANISQKYERSVNRFASSQSEENSKFINKLNKSMKDFETWKTRATEKRSWRKFAFLKDFKLPMIPASTLVTPATPAEKEQFYAACERYEKLAVGDEIEIPQEEEPKVPNAGQQSTVVQGQEGFPEFPVRRKKKVSRKPKPRVSKRRKRVNSDDEEWAPSRKRRIVKS